VEFKGHATLAEILWCHIMEIGSKIENVMVDVCKVCPTSYDIPIIPDIIPVSHALDTSWCLTDNSYNVLS